MIISPSTIAVLDENSVSRAATVQVLHALQHTILEAASEFQLRERRDRDIDLLILGGACAEYSQTRIDEILGPAVQNRRAAILRILPSTAGGSETTSENHGEAYLTHPVSSSVLISMVDALLRARKAELELALSLEREQVARAETEQARRSEEQFLGSLGHELRTPLNAIVGWSDVLIRMPREADFMQGLRAIERNARLQAQLIDDLLDMARINSGRMRLELELIDPCSVLESALIAASAAAKAKEIRLERVGDFGQDGRSQVRADVVRLQQVFGNLLANAIKFTPKSGRVEVDIRSDGSTIDFVFSDNGCGIESERLPKIFERFRQSDSKERRTSGGLGLGLAIARHLVEMQNGKISVLSDGPGSGACFTVSLPLAS